MKNEFFAIERMRGVILGEASHREVTGCVLVCLQCAKKFWIQTTYDLKTYSCPNCNYLAYIPEEAYQ